MGPRSPDAKPRWVRAADGTVCKRCTFAGHARFRHLPKPEKPLPARVVLRWWRGLPEPETVQLVDLPLCETHARRTARRLGTSLPPWSQPALTIDSGQQGGPC